MKTKQDIRKYIKTLFWEQNREKRNIKDIIIEEKVLDYIEKQSVQNICIYENMDDEVDTKVLITKLEEIGKNIYTPQVISETEMILIDKEYEIYEKEIDIFIMGDDWEGRFDHLKKYCDVVYLPRTPSISTTEVIEIIKEKA